MLKKTITFSFLLVLSFYLLLFISVPIILAQAAPSPAPAPAPAPTPAPTPAPSPAPAPSGASSTSSDIILKLQQPFGTLAQELNITSESIGVYIKAIYVFASTAIIVIAIVAVMAGGIQWLTSAGNPQKIGQAKDTILKALLGLFIAIFAVFILETVSPGTVTFNPINVEVITPNNCCEYLVPGESNKSYDYMEQKECSDKQGKIVDTSKCLGVANFNAEQLAAQSCHTCYNEACADRNLINISQPCPQGQHCCGSAAPKQASDCISGNMTPKNQCVCRNTNECKPNEWCWKYDLPGVPGICTPKKSSGQSCGDTQITLFTGALIYDVIVADNFQCISGICAEIQFRTIRGGTAVTARKACIPQRNQGVSGTWQNGKPTGGEYCNQSYQCKGGYCYADRYNGWEGMCLHDPVPPGLPCDERKLDGATIGDAALSNAPCAGDACASLKNVGSGNCPF